MESTSDLGNLSNWFLRIRVSGRKRIHLLAAHDPAGPAWPEAQQVPWLFLIAIDFLLFLFLWPSSGVLFISSTKSTCALTLNVNCEYFLVVQRNKMNEFICWVANGVGSRDRERLDALSAIECWSRESQKNADTWSLALMAAVSFDPSIDRCSRSRSTTDSRLMRTGGQKCAHGPSLASNHE